MSTMSSRVAFRLGGLFCNVSVPKMSFKDSSVSSGSLAVWSYLASGYIDLTYLAVGKVQHLPDPVDAVNLSMVKIEGRLA